MKVIIWGHKLYSHTHSFIHYGFHKAFKAMGHETYWFDDNDNVSTFDFSNCLFLTEGQVCNKMPMRKDCKYIIHNPSDARFRDAGLQAFNMQVYNRDCTQFEKINDYTFCLHDCIFQPWATDLLPDEINLDDADSPKDNRIYFVGSISGGWNDITKECNRLEAASKTKGIKFVKIGGGNVSMEESIRHIKSAYCAPILQSVKQREITYIPCRIFKNISYGQYPMTNCEHLQFLFPGNVVYNDDTYQLFFDFETRKNNKILKEMMKEVKEKHTYVNRIEQLLKFI